MATVKKTSKNLKTPQIEKPPPMAIADKARMALLPSVNGAAVIEAYQANVMGKDADMNAMVDRLRETFIEVKGGDLRTLEAMLISQATALQTIFTSLARRASFQERLPQYQAFLGLALKAQSQSRAIISALVDLKYPRQATFVKQANIANGPQQVNNGTAPKALFDQHAHSPAHAKEIKSQQTKLLEQIHGQSGQRMDARTAPAAKRSYSAVEAVEQVYRAKESKK